MTLPTPLVSTDWLAANLDRPELRLYDATVFLHPNPNGYGYLAESGREAWTLAHIPGAMFMDLENELSDPSTGMPFMMPAAATAAKAFAGYGIASDSLIVVYSAGSMMWSTRVWWMLRSLGCEHVAVLDGGWEKWQKEARPVTAAVSRYAPGNFSARPRPELWADQAAMLQAMEAGGVCTINALSPAVYSGETNRYGRAGHLPGSHNVFYGDLLEPGSNTFRSAAELQALFAASGALASPRVICYCGGGISATMDALALTLAGQHHVAIYDGSMSEWVKDAALPLRLGNTP